MSFDILAPHYRWMEAVLAGEKLQRCRAAFLPQISRAENILLLGEGHGRALVECRRRFPSANVTCIDASQRMLVEARRRLDCHNLYDTNTQFVHADVFAWQPPSGGYDLIVTNFFLDCFRADQLEILVKKIGASATSDANWLLADFQIPSSGFGRIRSRVIIWSMYVFFRVITRLPARRLTAPDPYLKNTGFKLHQRTDAEWGLLHSDWWKR